MSLGRYIPETDITGWKSPVRGLQTQEARAQGTHPGKAPSAQHGTHQNPGFSGPAAYCRHPWNLSQNVGSTILSGEQNNRIYSVTLANLLVFHFLICSNSSFTHLSGWYQILFEAVCMKLLCNLESDNCTLRQ